MSALAFHHIGVAVSDMQTALKSYQQIFGYELVAGPFDDHVQGVCVSFLRRSGKGDPTLELVASLGEGSPIDSILKKGGGAYHVCYEVAELTEAMVDLRSKGCLILSKPQPAVAFNGRSIVWLYTPTHHLVELVESPREPS